MEEQIYNNTQVTTGARVSILLTHVHKINW